MAHPLRAALFERWLAEAEPGAIYCYHRGELARDRVGDEILDALANRVQSLSCGSYDVVSRCGHVRGLLVGTRVVEVSTQRQQGETMYIARKRASHD